MLGAPPPSAAAIDAMISLFYGLNSSLYVFCNLQVVKDFDKVDASKVEVTSHFSRDLGLDSLDTSKSQCNIMKMC